MSLTEFLNEDVDKAAPESSEYFDDLKMLFSHLKGDHIRDLIEEFALYEMTDWPGNVALYRGDEFVGFYHCHLLMLKDDCRGRNLSVPLILEAASRRPPPAPRTLTDRGRAALTRAWEVAHNPTTNPYP